MLCEYEVGNITFDQFDSNILANLHLDSEKQIEELVTILSTGFKRENLKNHSLIE
jgi:hypothetical protein